MTPQKRICFTDVTCSLARCAGTNCLWTECIATRPEMDSRRNSKTWATSNCCAEFSNLSQNPRIRSNTTDITRRKQEARKPGGEDRETRRSESTRREDGRKPQISSRTCYRSQRNSYVNSSIFLRTRHFLLDHCSSTFTMLMTAVLLLLSPSQCP